MPRFHFHTEDGGRDVDAEGAEFPDLAAARADATRYLAERLKEQPDAIWRHGALRVVVTDDAGAMLCVLALLAIEPP